MSANKHASAHEKKDWRTRLKQARAKLHEQLSIEDDRVSYFEWITVAVIILSSLTIGVKTYSLPPVVLLILETMDTAVVVYFVIEILARLATEERMRDFFKGGWNVFDTLIVVASIIPLDQSEYVLLGRMLRLFRVMRLIAFLPKLRDLISSMLYAIPKVSYVLLLMFLVFYIYGAFGSFMFVEINPELWGNIGVSMLTMFRIATLEDWTDVMYETMEVYPLSWIFYISFIALTTFIILNMIVGVIVQVMHEKTEHLPDADSVTTNERMARVESELIAIRKSVEQRENFAGHSRD